MSSWPVEGDALGLPAAPDARELLAWGSTVRMPERAVSTITGSKHSMMANPTAPEWVNRVLA